MRISDWSSDVCSSDLGVERREADAAAAYDRDGLARRHLARVEDRPRARRHRAADHRGAVEWHVGVDRDARMFVDEHRFGKGRKVEHRSEEHTSELQSLMRISYAVFCLKKKKNNK